MNKVWNNVGYILVMFGSGVSACHPPAGRESESSSMGDVVPAHREGLVVILGSDFLTDCLNHGARWRRALTNTGDSIRVTFVYDGPDRRRVELALRDQRINVQVLSLDGAVRSGALPKRALDPFDRATLVEILWRHGHGGLEMQVASGRGLELARYPSAKLAQWPEPGPALTTSHLEVNNDP